MIPQAYIQAWTAHVPWPDARQVEQDLLICRALCDLYSAQDLKGRIAFRGGTAINKLLFKDPLRYTVLRLRLSPSRRKSCSAPSSALFYSAGRTLISRIKGVPWKLSEKVIEELREKKYPRLLSA